MAAESFFVQFGFIIFFSTIGGLLAIRFKQPAVLGLLAIGGLIGPHGLGIIAQSELIKLFEDIGAVLLLFTIGIEFSMHKLRRLGMSAIFAFAIKMGIAFLVGYEIAVAMNLSFLASLYLGAILSVTSTAIMIKIVEYGGYLKRKEMPLLISVLIFEDIFAIVALTFFSSIQKGKVDNLQLLLSFLPALALIGVSYFVVLKLFEKLLKWLESSSNSSSLPLLALSLCFGMSYLAVLLGLTPSIGAFLGGSIVASLHEGRALKKAIGGFTMSFSAIFFFAMGLGIDFGGVLPNLNLILLLVGATIVGKFVGTVLGTYFSGVPGSAALFSGLAMLPIGEFSLIHAKNAAEAGVFPFDIVSIIAVTVFLTASISAAVVGYHEQIYKLTSGLIPLQFKFASRRLSAYSFFVIKHLSPGEKFYKLFVTNLSKIIRNVIAIGIVIAAKAFAVDRLINAPGAVNIATAVIILYPLFKIAQYVKRVFDGLTDVFIRHHSLRQVDDHLRHNFAYALALLLMGFLVPVALYFLNLPTSLQPVNLVFFFLAFIFLWDVQKTIYNYASKDKIRLTRANRPLQHIDDK